MQIKLKIHLRPTNLALTSHNRLAASSSRPAADVATGLQLLY